MCRLTLRSVCYGAMLLLALPAAQLAAQETFTLTLDATKTWNNGANWVPAGTPAHTFPGANPVVVDDIAIVNATVTATVLDLNGGNYEIGVLNLQGIAGMAYDFASTNGQASLTLSEILYTTSAADQEIDFANSVSVIGKASGLVIHAVRNNLDFDTNFTGLGDVTTRGDEVITFDNRGPTNTIGEAAFAVAGNLIIEQTQVLNGLRGYSLDGRTVINYAPDFDADGVLDGVPEPVVGGLRFASAGQLEFNRQLDTGANGLIVAMNVTNDVTLATGVSNWRGIDGFRTQLHVGGNLLLDNGGASTLVNTYGVSRETSHGQTKWVIGGVVEDVADETLIWNGQGYLEFDGSGATDTTTRTADTIIQGGSILITADYNPLGTGNVVVNDFAGLVLNSTQTELPGQITVNAYGGLAGDLSGATYGTNVVLNANAAVRDTSGTNNPGIGVAGQTLLQGVTAADRGQTLNFDSGSAFRGAAFGAWSDFSDGTATSFYFNGTLETTEAGRDLNIAIMDNSGRGNDAGSPFVITAFQAQSGSTPTFNSGTGVVNIYAAGITDFRATGTSGLNGNFNTINFIGERELSPNTVAENDGQNYNQTRLLITDSSGTTGRVLSSGQTLNVVDAILYQATDNSDAYEAGAIINVGDRGHLYMAGRFRNNVIVNLGANSSTFINSTNRFNAGTFNVIDPSTLDGNDFAHLLVVDGDLDLTTPTIAAVLERSDIVFHDADADNHIIVLGEGRKLTSTYYASRDLDGSVTGQISVAADTTNVSLSSARRALDNAEITLDVNAISANFSNANNDLVLMVGDLYHYLGYGGDGFDNRMLVNQFGRVDIGAATAEIDELLHVSGELNLGDAATDVITVNGNVRANSTSGDQLLTMQGILSIGGDVFANTTRVEIDRIGAAVASPIVAGTVFINDGDFLVDDTTNVFLSQALLDGNIASQIVVNQRGQFEFQLRGDAQGDLTGPHMVEQLIRIEGINDRFGTVAPPSDNSQIFGDLTTNTGFTGENNIVQLQNVVLADGAQLGINRTEMFRANLTLEGTAGINQLGSADSFDLVNIASDTISSARHMAVGHRSFGNAATGHFVSTLWGNVSSDITLELIDTGFTVDASLGGAGILGEVILNGLATDDALNSVNGGIIAPNADYDFRMGSVSAVLRETGSIGLNKTTEGTVIVRGEADGLGLGNVLDAANLFSGNVNVLGGTLQLHGDVSGDGLTASALGVGASAVVLGDTSGSLDAAIVFGAQDAVNSAGDFDFNRAITVQGGSTGTKTIGVVTGVANGETANFNAAITLGDDLTIRVGQDDTALFSATGIIGESVAGSGVTIMGDGTVNFQAAHTYTGETIVREGTLVLEGAGSILGSSEITVFTPTSLRLDNSGTNLADRIGDTAAIRLTDGGHFEFIGNAAGASTETFGDLVIARGANMVTVNAGAGQSATVTSSSLQRPATGTVLFRGTNLGATPGADVANLLFTSAPALTGGGGAAGTTSISILRYAIGDTTSAGNGNTLVTYDTNGIRPLDVNTELAAVTDAASFAGLASTDNARAVLSAGGLAGLLGRTVNAMVIENNSGASATFNGSGPLNVTGSAMLFTGANEVVLDDWSSITSGATGELIVHVADAAQTVQFRAPVGDTETFITGGTGTLQLDGLLSNNSTRTGLTAVNGGTLLVLDNATQAANGGGSTLNMNTLNRNPFGTGDIALNGSTLHIRNNGSTVSGGAVHYHNDIIVNRDSIIRFGLEDTSLVGSTLINRQLRFDDLSVADGVTLRFERDQGQSIRFMGDVVVPDAGRITLDTSSSLSLIFDNASTWSGSGDVYFTGDSTGSNLQLFNNDGEMGGFSGRMFFQTGTDLHIFNNEGATDGGTTIFTDVGGTGGLVIDLIDDVLFRAKADRTVFTTPIFWRDVSGDLIVQSDGGSTTVSRLGNEINIQQFEIAGASAVNISTPAAHDYFLTIDEVTLAGDGAIFNVGTNPEEYDDPGAGTGTLTGNTRALLEVGSITDNDNGYGFRKAGVGTMVLNGSNVIGGFIDAEDGVLDVRADGALGDAIFGTIVDDDSDDNAQVRFTNVDYLTDELLKIRNDGPGGQGALVGSGVSEFAGRIQVGDSVGQTPRIGTLDAADVFTLSGDILMFAGSDIEFSGPGRIQVSGTINSATASGNGNTAGTDITVMGGATVHLSGVNTYHGETYVLDGTLELGGNAIAKQDGALGNHNTPVVLGALTGQASTSLLIDGDFEMNRFITVRAGNLGTSTIGTTDNATNALISGDIELQKSVTLSAAAGSTLGITGEIFGEGGVSIVGGGNVVYGSLVNRYSGNTSVSGGSSLAIDSVYQLGGSILTLDGGTLSVTDSMFFNTNTISLGAGGGTLDVANGEQVAFEGNITGAGSLTKTGGGTAALVAGVTYDYDGATNINAGTLRVNGTLDSDGGVFVNSGATLAGSGTLVDNLTINSGATVSPGNSPGPLGAGDTVWNGDSDFDLEINDANGAAGVNWDLLAITGTLTINATSAAPIDLNVDSLLSSNNAPGAMDNFDPFQSYVDIWSFVTTTGGITLTGLTGGETVDDLFNIDVTDLVAYFPDAATGQFFVSMDGGSSNLYLSYTAVPEPGSMLLAALASLGLAGYGWRRKKRKVAAG